MTNLRYNPVRNLPVARFYYKGNHSHPIRRTVLVVEQTSKIIKGYELRSGSKVLKAENAPIRSFSRENIATYGELRMDNKSRSKRQNRNANTTLTRSGLIDLVVSGV